jgi:ubiquinol-cytochrome c reductase iron-sulfur subunit
MDLVDNRLSRRNFLTISTAAMGAALGAAATYTLLDSMEPSERALAEGAPVDANVGGLASGELKVIAWRGMPVWLLRRSPDMLATLGDHDAVLSDPTSVAPQQPEYCHNMTRSLKPEVFVAIGVCTHLGCSPTFRLADGSAELGANWPGGFFCPCHGSKFDLAGRVFKNVPAPTNLIVPPYRYVDAGRIVIGEDTPA